MGIRRTRDESYEIAAAKDVVYERCVAALRHGGFSAINENRLISQVTACYHKMTCWGEIEVTVKAKDEGTTVISTHASASVDNIYALFRSPVEKISKIFKNSL